MTQHYKIYATDRLPGNIFERLSAQGHEINFWNSDENGIISSDKIAEHAKDCDILISMLSNNLDAPTLKKLPNLKLISQYAVGFNNIDTSYTNANNIKVTNTPNVLTKATAELAMALMLTVARNLESARQNVIDKKWDTWLPCGFIGHSTFNLKHGIIGAGRIGTQFARMCHSAFEQEIFYTGPRRKEEIEKLTNAKYLQLEELVATCDIISIHCPYNQDTHQLLNQDIFSRMKNKVILINTARGEIIDEDALYNFFRNNPAARAGLDVVCNEPLSDDSPLRGLDNIYILPHIGSANEVARNEMASLIYDNIAAFTQGNNLISPV